MSERVWRYTLRQTETGWLLIESHEASTWTSDGWRTHGGYRGLEDALDAIPHDVDTNRVRLEWPYTQHQQGLLIEWREARREGGQREGQREDLAKPVGEGTVTAVRAVYTPDVGTRYFAMFGSEVGFRLPSKEALILIRDGTPLDVHISEVAVIRETREFEE